MGGAVGVVRLDNRFTSALGALTQDQARSRFRATIPLKSEEKQGRVFSRLAAASATSAVGLPSGRGSSYQRARNS
jgi:hypothetical protein